ncbi:CRISPR-associated endonuclease Cas3'' [Streptomyces sp. SKN60]|uniref:CRISPR-associated endonuclease Cas3'' n=1 Tax=Streptomyces sp. SKN60 TaxID=2855506 RepID=UPI002247610A|nr:CRISPR-associated endonuclease Cas3'' [Streptomyces sp. SKN60]MCX2182674.1 CRISPR-associated endonuclease Cas3'' [Streptomyces sp. SKN60]
MGVVDDGRNGGLPLCLWGKWKFSKRFQLGYPVLFHMLDVAAIAGVLWHRYLTRQERRLIAAGLGLGAADARRVVMFWAGCHDLGKVSRFQECEPAGWARVSDDLQADTGGWRLIAHERASMHAMVGILAGFGYERTGNASPAVRAAQIIGGHHGWFHQCDVYGAASGPRVAAELGGPLWQDIRWRYTAQIRYQTQALAVPPRVSVPAAVLIAGLIMVADRLASQPHVWIPRAMAPAFGASAHYASAWRPASQEAEEPWAAAVVTASGLERADLPEVPFTTAHPHLERPNQLQASLMNQLDQAVAANGAGILVITDRTGAGKTVAMLEAQRIFNLHCGTRGAAILQPSTAIADAMYETLRDYVAAHQPERAPVSLVHNHSWQNTAYTDQFLARNGQITLDEYFTDTPEADGRPEKKVTVPDPWLRGFDRALLAQFTVATLDQTLMSVLPTRYSAFRMLGMSGRTVIIDEAHAYSPYTLRLMERFVHWLGALGCPVVVVSATLPAAVSAGLVRAYLTGAGHTGLAGRSVTVPYPGWLFAAASDASTTVMADGPRRLHVKEQRSTIEMIIRDVTYQRLGEETRAIAAGERLDRIVQEIQPVAEHGGCAAVECATVADAQDTYLHLRKILKAAGIRAGTDLVLLHGRIPGQRRGPLTRRIRDVLGPRGKRPYRLIVVTTSLLEMSLDIDLDVLVSDLASMHRLLQRAGRLWRFELLWRQQNTTKRRDRRPPWIRERGPRLSVLNPVHEGRTDIPQAWRSSDTELWMHQSAAALHTGLRTVTLPDDVPHLIEEMHAGTAGSHSEFAAMEAAHVSSLRYETHLGDTQAIPPPVRIGSLADLHRRPTTPGNAPTRAGTCPRRLLPCYLQPMTSHLTLDEKGTWPLPAGPRLKPVEIRRLLQCVVSVPESWVSGPPGQEQPALPEAWLQHPLLADLVPLFHDLASPQPASFGRHWLSMDAELGLVHRKQDS